MDVFRVRDRVVTDYREFVEGFLSVADPRIEAHIRAEIDTGLLWPDAYVSLNPGFESGGSVDELVGEGLLDARCSQIFSIPEGRPLRLHRHQREAVEAVAQLGLLAPHSRDVVPLRADHDGVGN